MKNQYIKPAIRIPELDVEFLLAGGSGDVETHDLFGNQSATPRGFSTSGLKTYDEFRWGESAVSDKLNENGNDMDWNLY